MTSDKIYEFISHMGNNLCPYSVATGEENYYLLAPNFEFVKFIKKDKVDYEMLYWKGCILVKGNLLKNWNYVKFIGIMIRRNC